MFDLGIAVSHGGLAFCLPEVWKGKNEWTQDSKLYYPIRGKGWMSLGGRQTIFKLRHLYFIPPCRRISFGTPSSMDVQFLHFYPQTMLLQRRLAASRRVVCFSRAFSDRWARTCQIIPRFITNGATEDACRIQAMLQEVFGTLLANLPEESLEERSLYDRLEPALKMLENDEGRLPSLSEMARSVFLSAEHFHRLFRKAFHTTPLHYALKRRMNLAQQLLSEGRLSVAGVAQRCGYDDPFYFSRIFHRHFGVTPKKVSLGRALVVLP